MSLKLCFVFIWNIFWLFRSIHCHVIDLALHDDFDPSVKLLTFKANNSVFYVKLFPNSLISHEDSHSPQERCASYSGQILSPITGQMVASICQLGSQQQVIGSFSLEDGRLFRMQPYFNGTHQLTSFRDGSLSNPTSLEKFKITLPARVRRSAGVPGREIYNRLFTIETIIFVDQSLIDRFHGNLRDVQRLVLAIMNEVQMIYNFDSLKIRIRILIKKIVYLDNKTADIPDPADGDIDQYLDNFCAWQKRLWLRANQTLKWDHALMLTGMDLYKRLGPNGRKNKKVLGLAWVNGMCRPAYSCTLNEGKNFEAAYVIAHEMAHSLGMLHDGYDNNCDPDQFIMSEKTGPGKINWSPCSNLYLENFLTKTKIKCLETTRSEKWNVFRDAQEDNRLPGEQYSLDRQCQLALGAKYRAYITPKAPFNDVCRELWCSAGTWATPAHPALEGSECGKSPSITMCYQGDCVPRNKARQAMKTKKSRNTVMSNQRMAIGKSPNHSVANSGVKNSSTFMRKVQTFLKSTLSGIVRFFNG